MLGRGYSQPIGSETLRIVLLNHFSKEFAERVYSHELSTFGHDQTIVHALISTIIELEKRVKELEKK